MSPFYQLFLHDKWVNVFFFLNISIFSTDYENHIIEVITFSYHVMTTTSKIRAKTLGH